MTSTLSSSAPQTFPSGLRPAVKDCFGLHGYSAFGYVAKEEIGVGRKSATSVGLTTDLIHWLQAGKTVDILRYAAESTDLLPPSALPRQQAYLLPGFSTPGLRPPPPFRGTLLPSVSGSLRLSPPSRPAGCRLPADASHRAAVVDIADSGGPRMFAALRQRPCLRECCPAIGCRHPTILLPQRLQLSISIYCITAIQDLKTNDDSRLRRNFVSVVCECQCKASVVHSHYGLNRQCCGSGSRKAVSCGICTGKPAQKSCWGYSAPLCRRSSKRRATGCWRSR